MIWVLFFDDEKRRGLTKIRMNVPEKVIWQEELVWYVAW
jgi:hypothetical protein